MEDEEVENESPSDKIYLKEFIRMWETCPELWNTSSPVYRDKVKKKIALDKLLVIYKKIKPASTTEDVKRKLNSLRTNFRKELKKIFQSKTSGKGTDEVYVPSSWTYYELLFLKNDEQPVQLITQKNESNSHSMSSMDPSAPPTPPETKRKKKGIDEVFLERAVSFLEKSENDSEDLEEHLAKVWASKLRKVAPTQKIFAEKAINDVLFEAELGNLNKNSVKINDCISSPAGSPITLNTTFSYDSNPSNPKLNPSPLPATQPTLKYFDFSQQKDLIQTQLYPTETATLYSINQNKPIISTGDPSKILLKPRDNPPRPQVIAIDLSSQETLHGVASGMTTTTIADVHVSAKKTSESPKMSIKQFLDTFDYNNETE